MTLWVLFWVATAAVCVIGLLSVLDAVTNPRTGWYWWWATSMGVATVSWTWLGVYLGNHG